MHKQILVPFSYESCTNLYEQGSATYTLVGKLHKALVAAFNFTSLEIAVQHTPGCFAVVRVSGIVYNAHDGATLARLIRMVADQIGAEREVSFAEETQFGVVGPGEALKEAVDKVSRELWENINKAVFGNSEGERRKGERRVTPCNYKDAFPHFMARGDHGRRDLSDRRGRKVRNVG